MNWKEQYFDTLRILSEVRKERDALETENKKLQEILAFDADHTKLQKITCPCCRTYVEAELPYQRNSFSLSVAKKNMELEKELDALRAQLTGKQL